MQGFSAQPDLDAGDGPVGETSWSRCNTVGEDGRKTCPSPCVLVLDRVTPVGQEHLLLTRSGAGAPELQRWARCLPVFALPPRQDKYRLPGAYRDKDVPPTGAGEMPRGYPAAVAKVSGFSAAAS